MIRPFLGQSLKINKTTDLEQTELQPMSASQSEGVVSQFSANVASQYSGAVRRFLSNGCFGSNPDAGLDSI